MSTSLYKRTEIVGRGKFGVVYKGYNKQTNKLVAIKVLNLDTQEDEVADVQQEIQFLTELKNVPNVTHYYGSFLNDTKLWIIMDYCAGGSLRTLLKAGPFEDRYTGVIMRELLYALSAVHKLGVIHRDIKAANVLITKEGYVQMCDFGVAAKITANAVKRTTMAGTPYWMAPEVIREGDVYNSKADIWSLGITIYEIATGNPPYCDKDAMWAMQLISKLTPPRLEGREYSTALKECIALCLDENPEERPSADDLLLKCRLVKTYKNHSRSILKEVVSRYLLWRDHNSSRDSVFVNLDDEIPQNEDIESDARPQGNDKEEAGAVSRDNSNSNQIQVKWDFDSLSSREYIVENDIDLDRVDESYHDTDETGHDTYQTLPTLQTGANSEGYNNSTAGKFTSNGYNLSTLQATTKSSTNEIPKSLQMLFEDDSELPPVSSIPSNLGYEMPTALNSYLNERMDSPTIEIPDMDNLANFNSSHPALNKPPSLNHSQSASGNLESRYTSLSTTSALNNKPRKKTISNSLGSNANANNSNVPQILGQQSLATPHTPPYSSITMKTPSPKPPPTSAIINSISTSSPSKSMKALQTNSNPLLQPINFKLTGDSNGATNSPAFSQASQSSQASHTSQSSNATYTSIQSNAAPSVSSVASSVLVKPPTKSRSGHSFHIQMPTPSTAFNNLSALTNENYTPASQDNDNVNQFGINPSQLANQPLTMTPVTEKEHPFTNENENDHEPIHPAAAQARERSESNVSLRLKKGSVSNSAANLATTAGSSTNIVKDWNPAGANMFLSRGNGSISSASVAANTANVTKFPAIPQVNGEFFIDSTPKQKLVHELESMIKLFNQGLDALEENL